MMLVLASQSPRRQELLKLITEDFIIEASDVDESSDERDPAKLVEMLAKRKARDVFKKHPADIILGADTVVYANSEILGKPRDMADAKRMVCSLAGSMHEVYTGVCLCAEKTERTEVFSTKVYFNEISEAELENYLENAYVLDKAGAYAVQEAAARFVRRIEGCYFNVMGLPVSGVYQMLKAFKTGSFF
ncbi:MAG: Maf family protein [Christensenellaceae bacterium]|jgi:septum formation protein